MINVVVFGGLNTDLVANKVKRLLGPGEQTSGQEFKIGPGGKSANIARMIAAQLGPGAVAFVGRTSKDPFGLWKVPVEALTKAGVNTKYVQQTDVEASGKYPGIAMIAVDASGDNEIYLLPGVNEDFSILDIESSLAMFEEAGQNAGAAALSLEMPWNTAMHAIDKANEHRLKIFLDPGGMAEGQDGRLLLEKDIFLIKPNEHEAERLTGVKVTDLKTAGKAAQKLRTGKIENVLITHGSRGAYLFTANGSGHISPPSLSGPAKDKDSTGCGDQTLATFCAATIQGKDLFEAAKDAVLSGTLQLYKSGIDPVTRQEIEKYSG